MIIRKHGPAPTWKWWGCSGWKSSLKYLKKQILCIRLKIERGIVRMRVVFVPRSVEIKPLFSELKFWVEKVGKTFKRNWNSLSGLFRFLLIFLHSVSVTGGWEKAWCSCGKFPLWGETLYCFIAKLRYLSRSCLRVYSISQRENLSARGNLYTRTCGLFSCSTPFKARFAKSGGLT